MNHGVHLMYIVKVLAVHQPEYIVLSVLLRTLTVHQAFIMHDANKLVAPQLSLEW